MANEQQLERLREGVGAWNEWVRLRRLARAPGVRHSGAKVGVGSFWADLRECDLHGADLYQGTPGAGWSGIDLIGADLRGANLRHTNLAWANLTGATLAGADAHGASLMNARLQGANLSGADLSDALLGGANLLSANLKNARLEKAYLYETVFADTDLSGVTGLTECRYAGPCTVDHRTILNYDPVPAVFLRGCGLSEELVQYLLSLRSSVVNFYSRFICYSAQDQNFAERLHGDLQSVGVRCWFAPSDLKLGDLFRSRIEESIGQFDKLLVVLSCNSIKSAWVEEEVERALEKEREQGKPVLFPIRLDDAVLETDRAWAASLRRTRHIGDFRNWKDYGHYQAHFRSLLSSLQPGPASQELSRLTG